jgi:hypothetical protein
MEGIAWPQEYGQRTTQDLAYRMIVQFIPSGSGVAVERSVLRLPDSLYNPMMVSRLTDKTPEDYASAKVTYVIASSDAFGPIFRNPDEHRETYEQYDRLLAAGKCLPPVEPTDRVPGPEIRICQLRSPHQ